MILVISTGSSSIKFQLFQQDENQAFISICKGWAERIFVDGVITIEYKGEKHTYEKPLTNYVETINYIFDYLKALKVINSIEEIKGIGHRVVHGADQFKQSMLASQKVIKELEQINLAPLHNPAAIAVLKIMDEMLNVKNVLVFDTSFHNTIEPEKFLYPVDYQWYEQFKVRRYGFHGISYRFICKKLAAILNKPENKVNAIVCHLGNGASVCAIKNGLSFNTSMGLTPLEGLMMGTRCGDIDPSIADYIASQTGQTISQITNSLNKQSGLLAISNISSDIRDVIKAMNSHDKRATLAIKMFVQRIAKYIVDYANQLKVALDAIVFTAGIGENSSLIRQMVIDEVSLLNLKIDVKANETKYDQFNLISQAPSQYPIYAIRTNEEIIICEDTNLLINQN